MNEYDMMLYEMLEKYDFEKIVEKISSRVYLKFHKRLKKDECYFHAKKSLEYYVDFPELCKVVTLDRITSEIVKNIRKK